MKFLIVFFLFFSLRLSAQPVSHSVKLVHYIFDEFTPGIVKMKSGTISNQVLNYNILTNEMIFSNNGNYLALADPGSVDTIEINKRRFIPLNNKFYEVLVNSNMPLLLEFTASISEPGVSAGYGGTSTTTASTSLKSLVSTGGAYELKLPDGFTVTPGYTYWIMEDSKLEKAGSQKQLIKIFPGKKEMIDKLIKEYHTNFSSRDDIIELVKKIE